MKAGSSGRVSRRRSAGGASRRAARSRPGTGAPAGPGSARPGPQQDQRRVEIGDETAISAGVKSRVRDRRGAAERVGGEEQGSEVAERRSSSRSPVRCRGAQRSRRRCARPPRSGRHGSSSRRRCRAEGLRARSCRGFRRRRRPVRRHVEGARGRGRTGPSSKSAGVIAPGPAGAPAASRGRSSGEGRGCRHRGREVKQGPCGRRDLGDHRDRGG